MNTASLKRAFERFCEGTSFHGFQQLFHAKNTFWKTFWTVICTSAIAVSTYQISQTVLQYINKPTNTVILVAEDADILYPRMRLCYWHWLFWVDFDKVEKLEMDTEALLYSFSYYTRIYTATPYDLDTAKQKLMQFLTVQNITSVFSFHQSIARKVPIVSDDDFPSYFNKMEVIYRDPGFLFCYTVSSVRMYEYLHNNSQSRRVVQFSTFNENFEYNRNNMSKFVTMAEYNRYMLRWIQHKTTYEIQHDGIGTNFTSFAPPVLLFANAFDEKNDIPILIETDFYSVVMKASAAIWQNDENTPCAEGSRSIGGNRTCQFTCEAKVYQANCSCIQFHYAVLNGEDNPKAFKICRNQFTVLSNDGERRTNSTDGDEMLTSQTCRRDAQVMETFSKCISNCVSPCEIWTYVTNVFLTTTSSFLRQIGTNRVTNITIEYPFKNDILVSVEVDILTWETFIGNVGGILGIWTGCSVISFIQLAYLFCCAGNSARICDRCIPSKK